MLTTVALGAITRFPLRQPSAPLLHCAAMKRDLLLLLALGALSTAACSSDSGDGGTGGADGSGATSGDTGGAIGTGGGSSDGGTGGTGAVAGTGASSGSGGGDGDTGGTGGGAPACTPGTGTEDVGTDSFLDRATCLTWQKSATISGSINARDALTHCNELTQDGLTWRLPTGPEIATYPGLPTNNFAYVAGPTFRPQSAPDDATGCATDTHTCNLAQYSTGNFTCAWQGPGGNPYPVLCVSGETPSGLDSAYEPATCCSSSSTFQPGDCSL